ncbi:MAG: hypothetical protein SFU55_05425 [Methylophilus sp.]|nr:hypothetical protein [Methylophilus sp.]
MNYSDGNDIRLGDIVLDKHVGQGVVVFCIDSGQYTEDYPQEEWEYLGKGVMVRFHDGGEVYYEGPEPYDGLNLIERA